MSRAQLFLNHSLVIRLVFKSGDNDNDLSISFHLIPSQPHFRSHRWLLLLFQMYNRDFNARDQFHCQLEFCLSMEFSKLNILWAAVALDRVHRPGDQNAAEGLFHASNTHKPVPGISYESNCIRLHLKGTFPLHFSRKILHASLCHKSIKPITQIVSNGLLPYIWTQMSGLVLSKWSTKEFLKALENNLICLLGLLFHGSVLLFCLLCPEKPTWKKVL